jgi:hypothetical protein
VEVFEELQPRRHCCRSPLAPTESQDTKAPACTRKSKSRSQQHKMTIKTNEQIRKSANNSTSIDQATNNSRQPTATTDRRKHVQVNRNGRSNVYKHNIPQTRSLTNVAAQAAPISSTSRSPKSRSTPLISNPPYLNCSECRRNKISTKLTAIENGAQEKPSWCFWIQSNERGKQRFKKK